MRRKKNLNAFQRSLSRAERKTLRGQSSQLNPPSGREPTLPWRVAEKRQSVLSHYFPNDEIRGHGLFFMERCSDNEIWFHFGDYEFHLTNRRGRIDIEPVEEYPRVERSKDDP